ncbi:MAG: MGDG synthase family glycosyltransferase [Terriglobia bacterium]
MAAVNPSRGWGDGAWRNPQVAPTAIHRLAPGGATSPCVDPKAECFWATHRVPSLESRIPNPALLMPTVLILTTSHGASHRRASEALRKCLHELDPKVTVEVADGIHHCAWWFRAYYDSYAIPLRYWPSLWRRIEGYQHRQSSTGPTSLYALGARPLFRYLQAGNPDVVVATEVGVCELAALYKRRSQAQFFLAALELLDFNRAWIQPEVDLYAVVHPDLGAELVAAGASPSKIFISGMPIDPVYACLPCRARARSRLAIRDDSPLILILFGGTGFGKPRQIMAELRRIRAPFQAAFIAGKNPKLEAELRQLCTGQSGWQALGWVDNIHEWITAADLVLSKPGGATVMEAAACGVPLLALDPLPGNEERTCAWLEKWGAGVWLRSFSGISGTVDRLLKSSAERGHLAAQSRAVSRPRAAYAIAEVLLARCGRR